MKKFIVLSGILALMSGAALNAQVTIGKDKSPEPFSVLELISNNTRGLRLPKLTTQQRNTLDFAGHQAEALGLTIFNTTTLCVETWNGIKWIAQCNCNRIISNDYSLCDYNNNIADLTTEVGGGVEWYANDADNNPLPATTVLISGTTYFAEQIGNCKNSEPRTPVTVILGDCSAPLDIAAYSIFSPVSVMYTYQYQDLTLYKSITSSSDAISFKWYVKKKSVAGNGTVITGATSATYRIPSNYRNSNDTLVFTCEYTNPVTATPKTVSTEIEFIKLNENNYETIGGIKYYWVELDVPTTNTSPNYSNASGKLKVLATSLGTETANAADFGDIYQWGRISDGHQTIGWSYTESGTTTKTRIVDFDAATTANQIAKTTGTIAYDSNLPSLASDANPTPFWQITDNDHKGKFVTSNNNVWQASTGNADQYILATSTYAKTANDPCPSGWHVPTTHEWGALGSTNVNFNVTQQRYPTTYNYWRYPSSASFGSSAHVGGIVVTQGTNQNGTARLFLPAAGIRHNKNSIGLSLIGGNGYYWSSTNSSTAAYALIFASGNVQTAAAIKGHGFSVRCVSE
jgi:uncharacterized protein (TIGR02145 family)